MIHFEPNLDQKVKSVHGDESGAAVCFMLLLLLLLLLHIAANLQKRGTWIDQGFDAKHPKWGPGRHRRAPRIPNPCNKDNVKCTKGRPCDRVMTPRAPRHKRCRVFFALKTRPVNSRLEPPRRLRRIPFF